MKKLFVFMLAAMLVVAFTVPASAVENKFGGYWRTRFMTYGSVNGLDNGAQDHSLVDTRTRLYYTAILHENLKFVNKFESDATWGDTGYGDIGADGVAFEVKNTYADFNLNNFNFVIGTQGFQWGRSGFLFDDDATGMKIVYRGADNFIPAFYWIRAFDGGADNTVGGDQGQDYDYYTALVNYKAGNMQFVPYITYLTTNSGGVIQNNVATNVGVVGEAQDLYYVGLDFNAKFDNWDLMLTGIYNGGDISDTGLNRDISAYLFDAAAKVKLSGFGVHGEALYASGDDDLTDNDGDAFVSPKGSSYTWSEGYAAGSIDKYAFSAGTTGNKNISNLMAFNLGATFAATKDLKFKVDFWNINLAEDNAAGDKDIGNEFSVKATYQVLKSLKLDVVGAWMVAGDAFEPAADSADPYELAAQLSLSF